MWKDLQEPKISEESRLSHARHRAYGSVVVSERMSLWSEVVEGEEKELFEALRRGEVKIPWPRIL